MSARAGSSIVGLRVGSSVDVFAVAMACIIGMWNQTLPRLYMKVTLLPVEEFWTAGMLFPRTWRWRGA
jgi:hypothetical protein